MGYIYKITNTITKKCYIGETKQSNPETRWREHKNTIKNGVGCPVLQSAAKKYGIENFTFEILFLISPKTIDGRLPLAVGNEMDSYYLFIH